MDDDNDYIDMQIDGAREAAREEVVEQITKALREAGYGCGCGPVDEPTDAWEFVRKHFGPTD